MKPENMTLHFGTNDAPYRTGTNITKDLIVLKDFILQKLPSCKKITLLSLTVSTDKESAKKSNQAFTNRLKEEVITFITRDNIIHEHLYQDGLHLNSVRFSILAENFLSYIQRN